MTIWYNGMRYPATQPLIQVQDLGLLRGYAIFDFLLVESGRPLFWTDYSERFFRSARLLGIQVPLSPAELLEEVMGLIAVNGMAEAAIRLLLTGGNSANAYRPASPNLAIIQEPYVPYPEERCGRGIGLQLAAYRRPLPQIKTTNYAEGIRLLPQLDASGDLEALYHDHGFVRETTRSNLFIVDAQGVLRTPKSGVLPGVTRKQILALAKSLGRVAEGPVRLGDLHAAREVFITGTTKRVMPVVRLDGRAVGNGQPGPVTRALQDAFARHAEAYLHTPPFAGGEP